LPEAALALARSIPREKLERDVVAWADQAPPRRRWGVAFSGGPDSLALLLLVWAHWPKRRRTMRVLHFDHRIRGAASRRDAAFSADVCRALGVKLVSGVWRGKHAGASEAEAREARMAFFQKHVRVLWLGHQQDDIAETMLMRLARGSGTAGLAAPRPIQPMPGGRMHVRPLLTLKKTEMVAALREARVEWREDATNATGRYLRNRMRNDVVPVWVAAAERDAAAGAAHSRRLLEEDDLALEAWLAELDPLGVAGRLDHGILAGKPRALLRRALHRWLRNQPRVGEISRQAFEALLEALLRGRPTRHSLGRHGFAVTNGKILRFEAYGKQGATFQRAAN
jgi:tRNA(Ile)-lysidine synthase